MANKALVYLYFGWSDFVSMQFFTVKNADVT